MSLGAGFMEFAQGWNQTVKGWYHEGAGNVESLWGSISGNETTSAEGAIENAEGNEQADRGENLMGDGISEMLGLVDHGSAPAGSPYDGMY
jgi:uncharacterized protein YjbJ (UPF0337 family)